MKATEWRAAPIAPHEAQGGRAATPATRLGWGRM